MQSLAVKQVREIPAVMRRLDPKALAIIEKLRTAAYARVSTDSSDQLNSYDAQIKFYTEYIKSNPKWSFVKMYSDEGITGTQIRNRKQFLQLVADAKAGLIDLIVTKSISRFARNVVDCLSTVRDLKDNHGVAVFFEKEGLMSTDPTAQLTLSIMASVAEEESRSISTNVKWRNQKKFEKGEIATGSGLYGYTIKNNNYIINPEEAIIVRRIYSEYLMGKSYKQIADGLMADGVKRTKRRKKKIRYGEERAEGDDGYETVEAEKWTEAGIQYMLSNERYSGNVINQKYYKLDVLSKVHKNLNDGTAKMYFVEDNHTGIIPKDIFTAVQAERAKRSDTHSADRYASKYAFSRKLVCGICGEHYGRSYQTYTKKGGVKVITYIWMCRAKADGRGCKSPRYKESEIEGAFIMMLNEAAGDRATLIAEAIESIERAIRASGDFDAEAIATELKAKQGEMLTLSKSASNDKQVIRLMDEIDILNNQMDICQQAGTNIVAMRYRIDEASELLESSQATTKFDPDIFKSVVDTCLIDQRQLAVTFKCGIQLTQSF